MFKKALIASAMLVSVIGASAAETATFGIAGGSTPSSCSVELGNAGTADYTTLTRAQMSGLPVSNTNLGQQYVIGSKEIHISVTCGAATSVKLSFTDNKPGKASVESSSDSGRFGVVDGAGTTAIGGYDISLMGLVLDGAAPAGFLHTANGTTAWTATNPTIWSANYVAPGYTVGFIKTAGQVVPSSFTTLGGNLRTILNVSKTYMDAATNAVIFNGSGVITLTYL